MLLNYFHSIFCFYIQHCYCFGHYSHQHQFSFGTFCTCEFSQENLIILCYFTLIILNMSQYEPDKRLTLSFYILEQRAFVGWSKFLMFCFISRDFSVSWIFWSLIEFLNCCSKKNNTNVLVIPILMNNFCGK